MKVIEKKFRGSMLCRAISYPISYGIVKMLLEKGRLSFKEIASNVKRTKSVVCFHLTKLRMANIIRYEKKGKETTYWIKYPKEVAAIMTAIESMVKRVTQRIEKDI